MVSLVAMTPDEREERFAFSFDRYVAEMTEVNEITLEEATRRGTAEIEQILPAGPGTPGHHCLWMLSDGGERVGW